MVLRSWLGRLDVAEVIERVEMDAMAMKMSRVDEEMRVSTFLGRGF